LRKVIARFLKVLVLLGTIKSIAQGQDTIVNRMENVVKNDTLKAQENPFNPLMGFLSKENYSPQGSSANYIHSGIEGDVPFFRPEIFVKKGKPKFTQIKTRFNPVHDLSVLPINTDILGYWEKKNQLGLDLNQIAFVNWSAGGDNSISGIFKADFVRKYIKGRLSWENALNIKYGINKQSDRELRKTDDVLEFNSAFGYRSSAISDWYYVSKLNFKTQFTEGYNYPNTDDPVSRWFAPAYLFVGIGAEYVSPKTRIKYYISPLTYKATFVNDQRLADQGSFGVEAAVVDDLVNIIRRVKNYKAEVGLLFSNEWKKEIFKNIALEHKLTLYSDYVDHFGNIDVMWEFKLDLTVNDFVKANIGTYLLYDDNIKNKIEKGGVQITEGPRVQFKQTLGVGLVFSF
jgi:hypothetical protein